MLSIPSFLFFSLDKFEVSSPLLGNMSFLATPPVRSINATVASFREVSKHEAFEVPLEWDMFRRQTNYSIRTFLAASTDSCIVSIWVPPTASFKLDSSPISSYLNCCFKAEQISPPHNSIIVLNMSTMISVLPIPDFPAQTWCCLSRPFESPCYFGLDLLKHGRLCPFFSISVDDRPEVIASWKRGGRGDSYPKKLKWGKCEFTRAYRKINTRAKPWNWKCAHVPEPASEAQC